jgi:drug/metabolite transporter (DMT)-like permease
VARREVPSRRVIFGLGAAICWGLADLFAAFSGRRVGAATTVVVAQVASGLVIGAIVLVSGEVAGLGAVAGWLVPIAVVTAVAYLTLYRALELGPIALVSPLLASYAVFPVVLAVILLDETLGGVQLVGVAVTIGGAVLTSADIRAIRAGTRVPVPALPWAIASTVLFGIAAYAVAWASQQAGWLPSLWLVRTSTAVLFLLGAAVALASIVSAVSATYPLIPVFGGIALLGERPAPNQYVGVVFVIGGLMLLGTA